MMKIEQDRATSPEVPQQSRSTYATIEKLSPSLTVLTAKLWNTNQMVCLYFRPEPPIIPTQKIYANQNVLSINRKLNGSRLELDMLVFSESLLHLLSTTPQCFIIRCLEDGLPSLLSTTFQQMLQDCQIKAISENCQVRGEMQQFRTAFVQNTPSLNLTYRIIYDGSILRTEVEIKNPEHQPLLSLFKDIPKKPKIVKKTLKKILGGNQ